VLSLANAKIKTIAIIVCTRKSLMTCSYDEGSIVVTCKLQIGLNSDLRVKGTWAYCQLSADWVPDWISPPP